MLCAHRAAKYTILACCFGIALHLSSHVHAEDAHASEAAASPHADLFAFIREKANALVGANPKRYSNHISRGIELHEAVVQIAGGNVALANQPYALRWQHLGATDRKPDEDPIGPITYQMTSPNEAVIPAVGLKPGLYVVSLLQQQNDQYRLADAKTAWVFIAPANSFKSESDAFSSLERELGQQASTDASQKTAVLRAALDALAQQHDE
jgi:hypothetical protein